MGRDQYDVMSTDVTFCDEMWLWIDVVNWKKMCCELPTRQDSIEWWRLELHTDDARAKEDFLIQIQTGNVPKVLRLRRESHNTNEP